MDPKWVRVIAVVIVVGVVAAGLGFYYYKVSTSSNGCHLQSTNPLIVNQPERPDDLDPAVVYTTPGWGIAQQIYQTLVMYNGSSSSNMSGILAQNWSASSDGYHYNFTLRSGIHFSNGDPVNAYVMWYSLYRGLVMSQPLVFLLQENFWTPNGTYYSPASASQAENATLAAQLNSFNFFSPTPSQIAVMAAQNQSFRVLSSMTIQFNLGGGYLGNISYAFALDQIATPPYSAVDPAVIDANGGVQVGAPSTYMSTNMLGTGPFLLSAYNPATGYTLAPDPNYWAKSIAGGMPWNNVIQPAKSTVEVSFQSDPTIDYENLKNGAAAVASLAYIGPTTIQQLLSDSCIVAHALPSVYGSVSNAWWVYMDQNAPPFNNLSVREAVVHAINYSDIIRVAFAGYATQFTGPVPPGYPYYNDSIKGLSPYQFNSALAAQEMAASPWPGGYPNTINFEYTNVGTDWYNAALIIQQDLSAIGIHIALVPLSLKTLAAEQARDPSTGQCVSTESSNGGPFPIGLDYYTADYVAPDDATQLNALSYGGYNVCMSEYANATVDSLTLQAASQLNPTLAAQEYASIAQLMYYNYTNAWLVVPTAFAIYSTLVHGLVFNPMGSSGVFTMVWNTESAS